MSHLGIFESIDDAMFVANEQGHIIETNHAFSTTFGPNTHLQPITEIWPEISKSWDASINAARAGKQLRIDVQATSVDGRSLVFDVRTFAFDQTGAVEQLIAVVTRDVTAERNNRNLLEIQSTTDSLTGAYNRSQLDVLLDLEIRAARRRKTTGCFMFIDIDGFKSINDDFGHDAGDRVLKEISAVLHTNLRDSDVVGRIGGDEFGVILIDADQDSGVSKAKQLVTALKTSVRTSGDNGIKVSIGISVFPAQGENPEDVMKHADTAMYKAKEHQDEHVETWQG